MPRLSLTPAPEADAMTVQKAREMQQSADGPPRAYVALTSAAQYTDAEGTVHVLRGLFNNTAAAGTIAATCIEGTVKTLYIPAGHILPGFFTSITAGSLAVSDVLGVI